jgi:DNA gyrase inhibitor GyrI
MLVNKRIVAVISIGVILGAVAAGCQATRAGYESPKYRVQLKDHRIEIREYPELTVASTTLGSKEGDGFMQLFRYISGKNGGEQKIAMTTPVLMEGSSNQATMAFVLPAKYSTTDAPVPASNEVSLRKIEKATYAVLRYAGSRESEAKAKHLETLEHWVREHGYTTQGGPMYGFYDPPWIPSFFRRNEVMLRVIPK